MIADFDPAVEMPRLADSLIATFTEILRQPIGFDRDSLVVVDRFVTANGVSMQDDQRMIMAVGAYLGECIIVAYGGSWERDAHGFAVNLGDDFRVFPIVKALKHFQNGAEDSSLSLFDLLPRHLSGTLADRIE